MTAAPLLRISSSHREVRGYKRCAGGHQQSPASAAGNTTPSNIRTICDGRGIHKLGYIMWGLSALTLPLVPAVKLASCEYHYISYYPILPSLQSLNTNNVLSEQSGRSWGGPLISISILTGSRRNEVILTQMSIGIWCLFLTWPIVSVICIHNLHSPSTRSVYFSRLHPGFNSLGFNSNLLFVRIKQRA